ncbi:hypothetical protein PRVXT_000872 [Proteinivorax tanatarense]|uniref:Uncharacterized protein n=1 Tax=Proteinivorax tanatarense TaxID=1260629 RepID=A0AAU7VPG1_9FIRM
MKKINFLLVIFGAISGAALSIFFIFTMIQLGGQSDTPFEMSEDYMELVVRNVDPPGSPDYLQNQIKETISGREMLLIMENVDAMGLAVYDSKGALKKYPLKSGTYLSFEDYIENKPVILAKEDSIVHTVSSNENQYTLNDQVFKVQGIYDSSHPLYTHYTEYVYNFFHASDLRGTYYIDGEDLSVINDVIKILENNGYKAHVVNSKQENFSSTIRQLSNNGLYVATFLGTVFIYLNYYLFYRLYLLKNLKVFKIHLRFGATKTKLFLRWSITVLSSLCIGSAFSSIFYLLVIQRSEIQPSILGLITIMTANLAASYFMYLLAFISQKRLAFENGE